MGQHGIVYAAADNPESGRGLQGVGVFIAIQRDDGQAVPNVANEEHCLFAADAALTRHPRQCCVHLGQTVRSAASRRLSELNEQLLTWAVVDVVPVEQRN